MQRLKSSTVKSLGLFRKISAKAALILLLASSRSSAQDLLVSDRNFGFNVGLNLGFGTHVQRLGLNLNFYYVNDFFQANSEVRAYFSFKNLGPKFIYHELVLSQGVSFGYGVTHAMYNPFISSVSNQTRYTNAFAYAYNIYVNKKETSQHTGIFAFQFGKISLISENDLFAKPFFDRYRTAAFLLQYQYEDQFQAAINCTMWTGRMGKKSGIINTRFYNECFMDTTGGIYTNTSHGLLSAQVKYHVDYSQTAQVNAGIDAEQVRNAVQNKFIHDMRFIPKKWNKAKNCHIPMLDENNLPYLYSDDQKIRKPRLYLNVFSNANLFY